MDQEMKSKASEFPENKSLFFGFSMKKLIPSIIIFLIIIGMFSWGLSQIISSTRNKNYLAMVDGVPVYGYQVEKETKNLLKKLNYNKKTLTKDQELYFEKITLEYIIRKKISLLELKNIGLLISDNLAYEMLAQSDSNFFSENEFDKDKFYNFFDEKDDELDKYFDNLKFNLFNEFLSILNNNGNLVTDKVREKLLNFYQSSITYDLISIDANDIYIREKPKKEQLLSLYDTYGEKFIIPKSRKVSMLSLDDAKINVSVTKEETEEYYDNFFNSSYNKNLRDVKLVILNSQTDANKASFLLKKYKNDFTVLSDVFGKESVYNLKSVSLLEIDESLRDIIAKTPSNKIVGPVKIDDLYYIGLTTKIYDKNKAAIDNKVRNYIIDQIAKQKKCGKVLKLRDKIRDYISTGSSMEELSKKLSIPLKEKVLYLSSNQNQLEEEVFKESVGYINIFENPDNCDLVIYEVLQLFDGGKKNFEDSNEALKNLWTENKKIEVAKSRINKIYKEIKNNKEGVIDTVIIKTIDNKNVSYNKNLSISPAISLQTDLPKEMIKDILFAKTKENVLPPFCDNHEGSFKCYVSIIRDKNKIFSITKDQEKQLNDSLNKKQKEDFLKLFIDYLKIKYNVEYTS